MLVAIRASARFDIHGLDAAFNGLGQALLAASQRVRSAQTGRIENYLLAVCAWGVGVIAVAALALALR